MITNSLDYERSLGLGLKSSTGLSSIMVRYPRKHSLGLNLQLHNQVRCPFAFYVTLNPPNMGCRIISKLRDMKM